VAQVYTLLVGAFRDGASEVHIEPLAEEIRIRLRVDGRLVERSRLPRAALSALIYRLRILAGLRGETLPAATRFRTRLEGREAELDMLFYPSLFGEAVTLSIWDRSADAPTLDGLRLPAAEVAAIRRLLDPEGGGLVLVTGWEGRARAEMLYALAAAAGRPDRKVLTLERVVGHVVPDFVQTEVPGDWDQAAATVLGQPTDVALVEDVGTLPTCLAAFASAEHGTLVLGGLGFATNQTALAHLLALDVPRVPFLAALRGLVHVRRRGLQYWAETLAMTDGLREQLAARPPWTSPTS
jgi:type II secretory ATPase GspE/PulE/Tfp pilus assembly ATPase PilB-like protein